MAESREQFERERADHAREQTALQAQLRLVAIVESSDDAILGKDLNGIITDWNSGAERLYGYSAGEIIGKSIFLLIPDDRAHEFPEIMKKLQQGEIIKQFETVRQRKDGTLIEVSLTISPIIDTEGRIVGASIISRDITERRRTEKALRESEELMRMATSAGRMFAYEWDAATDEIVRSDGVTQILGENEGTHTTGQRILSMIPTEDKERLLAAVARLTPQEPHLRISYRMVRTDGAVVWVDRTSRAYFDENGKMLRMVGMIADVTERVRAEEALAAMSRKLLEAQEQERARIARELHDDIGQRVSLLATEIQQMMETLPDSAVELRNRMDEMEKWAWEISSGIQAMAHELHSSKLDYLGLAAAMRSFCTELSQKQRVDITFVDEGIPSVVPRDVSLCLFRVTQEALHNAVKHSGVRHFDVRVEGSPWEIHLTVRDSGVGFDPQLAEGTRGLGLISMRERVRLAEGTISITSKPESGTEVSVRVPLPAEAQTEQAKSAKS